MTQHTWLSSYVFVAQFPLGSQSTTPREYGALPVQVSQKVALSSERQIDPCGIRASSCLKKTIIISSTIISLVERLQLSAGSVQDVQNNHSTLTVCMALTTKKYPSSVYSDFAVFSNFTLAFFEDSGWYKVNYTFINNYNQFELQWGKGMQIQSKHLSFYVLVTKFLSNPIHCCYFYRKQNLNNVAGISLLSSVTQVTSYIIALPGQWHRNPSSHIAA